MRFKPHFKDSTGAFCSSFLFPKCKMNTTLISISLVIIILNIVVTFLLIEQFTNKQVLKVSIFVISMTKSIDRRQKMSKLLNNIEFTFLDAVDGKANMDEATSFLKNRYLSIESELNQGEMGCLLSHVSLWEKMKKDNISCSLIMEDDVIISYSINKIMDLVNNDHLKDFDVIYVGHCLSKKTGAFVDAIQDSYNIYKTTWSLCTHGYFISYVGACKLLDYFSAGKMSKAIDVELVFAIEKNIITAYSIYPTMINQDAIGSPSIIGSFGGRGA